MFVDYRFRHSVPHIRALLGVLKGTLNDPFKEARKPYTLKPWNLNPETLKPFSLKNPVSPAFTKKDPITWRGGVLYGSGPQV